jgi:hypothetical protein
MASDHLRMRSMIASFSADHLVKRLRTQISPDRHTQNGISARWAPLGPSAETSLETRLSRWPPADPRDDESEP